MQQFAFEKHKNIKHTLEDTDKVLRQRLNDKKQIQKHKQKCVKVGNNKEDNDKQIV